MVKIGINGFGRIGRLILRALLENYKDKIQVVGINDLGSIDTNAHLIKYDSTHGTLPHDVSTSKDGFKILNQNIKVFAERDPANLPWGKVGADIVLECTGLFLLVGKSIKDSNLPEEVRVGAIVRKSKVMMPKSTSVFEKNDIVVLLSKRDQLKEVENLFSITS
ncbi:MAG: hypothetical protein CMG02_01810 [Candidatus Marinimicrobia bacterium]|nr:hypothetical protein [Candidatus Neomarinimicrobiota bacterium]RPG05873.1 MAG: hypothetical protein CBE07_000415 [Pelagibacteraceae bacterium TMED247]